MLLFPKKVRFNKQKKFKSKFKRCENKKLVPGIGFLFGLKFLSTSRVSIQQLESARRVIRKKVKKKYLSQVVINTPTDLAVTKKSSGVRMGRGKGNFLLWSAIIKSGRVLFEFKRKIPSTVILRAVFAASFKFSSIVSFVKKYKNI